MSVNKCIGDHHERNELPSQHAPIVRPFSTIVHPCCDRFDHHGSCHAVGSTRRERARAHPRPCRRGNPGHRHAHRRQVQRAQHRGVRRNGRQQEAHPQRDRLRLLPQHQEELRPQHRLLWRHPLRHREARGLGRPPEESQAVHVLRHDLDQGQRLPHVPLGHHAV